MSSWIADCFWSFSDKVSPWFWPALIWNLWRLAPEIEAICRARPDAKFTLHVSWWGRVRLNWIFPPDTEPNLNRPYADNGPWQPGAPDDHFMQWKGMGLATEPVVPALNAGANGLEPSSLRASHPEPAPRPAMAGFNARGPLCPPTQLSLRARPPPFQPVPRPAPSRGPGTPFRSADPLAPEAPPRLRPPVLAAPVVFLQREQE